MQLQEKVKSDSCPGNLDSEVLGDSPGKAAGHWYLELQKNNSIMNHCITQLSGISYASFTHIFFYFLYKVLQSMIIPGVANEKQ